MTQKIVTSLTQLLLIFIISCKDTDKKQTELRPNSGNVFSTINYDSVIAYSYDGEGGNEIIDSKGRLMNTIKKQTILNESQIIRLTNSLCNKSNYGGDVAACFDPHLGIVFYKANRPKDHVSICMDCNYLVSSIKIPGSEGGFSDQGIKNIESWEIEFGFKK